MNSRFIKYLAVAALVCSGTVLYGQNTIKLSNGVSVNNVSAQRVMGGVSIVMDIDLSDVKVKSDNSVHVIPAIASETDTLRLAKISVLGRNRMYYFLRNDISPVEGENDKAWTVKEAPDTFRFSASVPYEEWMNGAHILLNETVLGCCNRTLLEEWAATGFEYSQPVIPEYKPQFVYLRPHAEVHKLRSLSAVSYVDFPVSKTTIYPNYRNNPVELGRILESVESVQHDTDVTIQRVFLKGFASPESPYDNNVRLAKGRTASIKSYVSKQCGIPADKIDTDYEPENWEGLEEYIINSDIAYKDAILDIVRNTNLHPDPREARLKRSYPKQYAYLLEHCYPALRKVDYVIEYEVREYTSLEEIKAAFETDPSKLSLEEFFMLAKSYPEESEDVDKVFLAAVKYFPKDPVANLNAANIDMKEGKLPNAGELLDKAGDSFEAMYARGVYNALVGHYDRALEFFSRVREHIPAAEEAYNTVSNIITISEILK